MRNQRWGLMSGLRSKEIGDDFTEVEKLSDRIWFWALIVSFFLRRRGETLELFFMFLGSGSASCSSISLHIR